MYNNKTFLITGATGGIGFSLSKYLAKENANIILCGRDNSKLQNALSEINAVSSADHSILEIDLENINDIKNKFSEVKAKYSIIDGFIHCAGTALLCPAHLTDYKKMMSTFNINYFSFVEIARFFAKQNFTKENHGNIIAISSIACILPEPARIAYASSKAALETAIKILAKELIRKNIRCNALRPALVKTNIAYDFFDMLGSNIDEQDIQPLGIIDPHEISTMIDYLLSNKGRKITGSIFEINAGGGFDRCANI